MQLAGLERFVERLEKHVTEAPGHDADREEEVGAAGDPASAIEREASAPNHAVQMRMMNRLPAPRVQNREEPDLRAEVLGVGRNRPERVGGGAKQQVVAGGCGSSRRSTSGR